MDAVQADRQPLQWMDAAKGVGILVVAAAHIFDGPAARTAYLFHMPLFFFISGYLFKPWPSMSAFARRRAASLLVPYAAFLAIVFPLQWLAQTGDASSHMKWQVAVFGPLFGGRALGGWTAVFWFTTCLFFVQLMANWLLAVPRRKVLLWCVASLVLGYLNEAFLPNFWFPWSANAALAALPFFMLGHALRRHPESKVFSLRLAIPLAVLGIGMVLVYPVPAAYNIKNTHYGFPILSFVAASAISVVVLAAVRRWLDVGLVGAGFAGVGRCSMVIMFLHQPIQIALADYTPFDATWIRFILAVGLSMLAYKLFELSSWGRRVFLGQPDARAPLPLVAGTSS